MKAPIPKIKPVKRERIIAITTYLLFLPSIEAFYILCFGYTKFRIIYSYS